jgi:catechol 2,3-dioxygenase-like lactoylglutathione lyase family enzyme
MRFGVNTRLSPAQVIEKAIDYFGKLGLTIVEREENSALLQGGGGHVRVIACKDGTTDVDIISEEWDYHVKQFIQRISE